MKTTLPVCFRHLFITLLLCALSFITNAQAVCSSLVYPCTNTFSIRGYFFDLKAGAGDILIESVSTITQNAGSRDVSMYYKPETTVGFEATDTPWTLIGSATNFTPLDSISCPIPRTQVPIPVNVCIPAGQRYGFYLITTTGTGTFEADDSRTEGDTAVSDGSLTLFAGKAASFNGAFSGTVLSNNKTLQGSINYSCGCTTGLTESKTDDSFRVFPVPAINELNVSLPEGSSMLNIYNAYGELVKTENIATKSSNGYWQTDISELPAGVFTVSVSGEHTNVRRTFVKM